MSSFIYIGAEKTSTTYLQRFFNINAQLIAQHYNIEYLDGNLQNFSIPVFIEAIKNNDTATLNFLMKNTSISLTCKCIISEFFYRDLKNKLHIQKFKSFLDKFVDNYKVVLYVRDQRDWLKSFYTTYIKNGNTLDFNDFVIKILQKKDVSIDYENRISKWEKVFNAELEVRTFDGRDLLQDIQNDFNARFENDKELKTPQKSNTSLPIQSLRILRAVNQLSIDTGTVTNVDRKALVKLLSEHPLGKEKTKLDSNLNKKIIERFRKGNQAVNNKWGTSLPVKS